MHRKALRRVCGIVSLAFLLAVAMTLRLDAQGGGVTVIEGGTLIDGTGRSPIANAVVVIQGNRIAAAGPKGTVREPPGANRIDASGKWVLPGLIESHGHYRE